jgi:hypothetical protein
LNFPPTIGIEPASSYVLLPNHNCREVCVSFLSRLIVIPAVMTMLAIPLVCEAQTSGARGKLIVTVSDQSGAVIPEATVTLVGLDAATKAAEIRPAKTLANGSATFEGLVLGRYSITAEFAGFDLGLLRDVRVRGGTTSTSSSCPSRT